LIPLKQTAWLMAAAAAMSFMIAEPATAATPQGFASTTLNVRAEVGILCQEAQHGMFPSPLVIDTQKVGDQVFPASADELVKCTNGIVFTVKVSSVNGTALNENCTSAGVSGMKLLSAGWPADQIPYTFSCAGDTDGAGHFTGAGFVTAKALGISIKIAEADAQAAIAHADYADTVTLTISY